MCDLTAPWFFFYSCSLLIIVDPTLWVFPKLPSQNKHVFPPNILLVEVLEHVLFAPGHFSCGRTLTLPQTNPGLQYLVPNQQRWFVFI